jgi:Zn-dependent peptidase ImmA (M78 family)
MSGAGTDGGGAVAAGDGYEGFGTRATFAIEIQLLPKPSGRVAPADCTGSHGALRLWVRDVNLMLRLKDRTPQAGLAAAEAAATQGFLAPLFRWIVDSWIPLLHEARLPPGGRWGDARPCGARLAYHAIRHAAEGDRRRLALWDEWRRRHALRAVCEPADLPDVFFQRLGEDIELTWGEAESPVGGAEAPLETEAAADANIAHVPVDAVARTLEAALLWFLGRPEVAASRWGRDLASRWSQLCAQPLGLNALFWYLDARPEGGNLSAVFLRALARLGGPIPRPEGVFWARLPLHLALFGDLAPDVTEQAAYNLLKACFAARTEAPEPDALAALVTEEPAWAATSPRHSGFALALEILEAADPDPEAALTRAEAMLGTLGVAVVDVDLGDVGPRGACFAGDGLSPTIIVNRQSRYNQGRGRRFTLAHEFCHILFDRDRHKSLAHSSEPWGPTAMEHRANAFAAMLLMPFYRVGRLQATEFAELKQEIDRLAHQLDVSRMALTYHLAAIGMISMQVRDRLFDG